MIKTDEGGTERQFNGKSSSQKVKIGPADQFTEKIKNTINQLKSQELTRTYNACYQIILKHQASTCYQKFIKRITQRDS